MHSFVTRSKPVSDIGTWFKSVVDSEIEPLLQEYWFDNDAKVQAAMKILREGAE